MESTTNIIQQINDILKPIIPVSKGFYVNVQNYKSFLGSNYIAIQIAAKDYDINGVNGQKPQCVSLLLDINTLELMPQIFGGNGGQSIYRKPNLEVREEKYLYMKSVKIPFRKLSKPNKDNVLSAIKKFAENYIILLKENKDVLMYKEYVDYDKLLN